MPKGIPGSGPYSRKKMRYGDGESESSPKKSRKRKARKTKPALALNLASAKPTSAKRIIMCGNCNGNIQLEWGWCAHCGVKIDEGEE